MCIADEVEAIPRARLMLRYCSYSGHIPVEGQHSGTCCEVACIERITYVMYRLVVDLVPSQVEDSQLKQSISIVQRSNVERGEKEEDFDFCSR